MTESDSGLKIVVLEQNKKVRKMKSVVLNLTCLKLQNQDRDDYLAYWLSNTSMLLFLLQKTLKDTTATPGKPPAPTSFFGRMTQVKKFLLIHF